MKKISFYLAIITALVFSSCDVIDEPYTEGGGPTPNPDSNKRTVLIEDYTGHQCPNCPEAAEIAHNLQSLYPGQVVVVAVHAGYFADLASPNYMTDFRNPVSTALDSYFGVSAVGNPNGLINRKEYSGNRIVGPGNWATYVADLLTQSPQASIKVEHTFNSGTKAIDASVKVKYAAAFDNPIMVSLYLTEDSIVDYQKNNNPSIGTVPEISNYVHMHVLRGSMNNTWGDTLSKVPVIAGDSITKNFNYTITSSAWNTSKMNIVAFIYDAVTLEVIQTVTVEL